MVQRYIQVYLWVGSCFLVHVGVIVRVVFCPEYEFRNLRTRVLSVNQLRDVKEEFVMSLIIEELR